MPTVWASTADESKQQSNNRRKTAAMQEMPTRDDGKNGNTATPVRPVALIIDHEYIKAALKIVSGAKSEIRVCAYAWRWYEHEPESDIQKLNVELLRAKQRGVLVKCLVDTEAMQKTFTTLGFNTRSVVNTRMLHTKAICADTDALLLGSHNLTKRAVTDNYEMSAIIYEYQAVAAFNDYFNKMWSSRG